MAGEMPNAVTASEKCNKRSSRQSGIARACSVEVKVGVMHVMKSPEDGNHMVRPMPPPVAIHMIPIFWRFHNVHHTDLDLDVSTAARFHFGEMIFSIGFLSLAVTVFGISPAMLVFFFMALESATLSSFELASANQTRTDFEPDHSDTPDAWHPSFNEDAVQNPALLPNVAQSISQSLPESQTRPSFLGRISQTRDGSRSPRLLAGP